MVVRVRVRVRVVVCAVAHLFLLLPLVEVPQPGAAWGLGPSGQLEVGRGNGGGMPGAGSCCEGGHCAGLSGTGGELNRIFAGHVAG